MERSNTRFHTLKPKQKEKAVMTVHPHATDFLELESACDAAQATKMGQPAQDQELLQVQESWYQKEKDRLISDLISVGVEPMAVLRLEQWIQIRNMYGLYQLSMLENCIRIKLPQSWFEQETVVSTAFGYQGEEAQISRFSGHALLEAEHLDHAALLAALMPENESLDWDLPKADDDASLRIALPPAPERERVVWQTLHASGAPVHVTADKSAIRFTPSLADQMRGSNVKSDILAEQWVDYEPILTVAHESAVAIVGQWGDYLFEKMAIQAALSAQ